MHIYEFPVEILYRIFDELDPGFFYDDVRRLAISKLWYQFALRRLLPEIRVKSTQSLLALVNKPDLLASAEPVVEAADLTVDGLGHALGPLADGFNGIREDNMNAFSDRIRAFDNSYRAIISFLNRCPRLHSLRLRMKPDQKVTDDISGLLLMMGGYCNIDRIYDTFAVRAGHLTSLVIDLAAGRTSSTIIPDPEDMDRLHLCLKLHCVLPWLRKFHCRMDRICPHLIDFDHSTEAVATWPLEEIIINLSMQEFRQDKYFHRLAKRPPCRVPVDCRDEDNARENPITSAIALREDFESWMLDLAHNLKHARMVRTIWDDYPFHWDFEAPYNSPQQKWPPWDVLAVEALNCHVYKLQPGDAWDAIGELIDDGPQLGPLDHVNDDTDSAGSVLSFSEDEGVIDDGQLDDGTDYVASILSVFGEEEGN